MLAYENNFSKALTEFKNALNYAPHSIRTKIHYSNLLSLQGYHDEALPLYRDIVSQQTASVAEVVAIITRVIEFLYIEEAKELVASSHIDQNAREYLTKFILKSNDIIDFLNSHNISFDYYRDLRKIMNDVAYHYFSITTELYTGNIVDKNDSTCTILIFIPIKEPSDIDLLGKMNDELQDKLVELYLERDLDFSSPEDRLVSYFNATVFYPEGQNVS